MCFGVLFRLIQCMSFRATSQRKNHYESWRLFETPWRSYDVSVIKCFLHRDSALNRDSISKLHNKKNIIPYFITRCWVLCVKFAHSKLGDREDISITYIIIIIKEISTFPLLSYFSMVVCMRWLYQHLLSISYISRERYGWFLLLLCSIVRCANDLEHYGSMVVFVYLHITLLHYHHYADDVYEGIGLLKC